MILKKDLEILSYNIEKYVIEAFQKAKINSTNNDYILFLANAHYDNTKEKSILNPYVLNYKPDENHDKFRLNILLDYANSHYSQNSFNTMDSEASVTFELMIYTHLWESKPFLKQFYRLSALIDGLEYQWKVLVPDSPKYKCIRSIKESFERSNIKLANIITGSYNSSLRNAFAHSEYTFSNFKNEIILKNYKGKPYEIDRISLNDWTVRFCNSFLLAYFFQKTYTEERHNLNEGESGYLVNIENGRGQSITKRIIYERRRDKFLVAKLG